MTTIIYCRKSTEDEDRQVQSIQSQEDEMRKVADRFGLKINKVYRESMSAKTTGRPIFAEMMAFIEKHQDCIILVWKLDRLARNMADGGRIIDLLQRSVIKEIRTYDAIHLPSDNVLTIAVQFGMANQYSRDLRQNVMRGNRTKLERGGWPNMAPFGYQNDKGNRTISVNPKTAPAVKRIFELYASGNYNLHSVTDAIYEQGFRTKSEKKIAKSKIHRILQNHFYCGIMVKNGIHYQGNHESLISTALFDQVQEILEGKHRVKRNTHMFPLRGFMTCDVCDCLLTATIQKGKYVYYYCTNWKGNCTQRNKHLKAEDAHILISSVLQNLVIDERLIEDAYRASKEKYRTKEKSVDSTRQSLVKRLALVKEQQDNLARRNGTPDDVYARNMASLKNEQVDLENELSKLGADPENEKISFEQVKNAFLEANSMAYMFLEVKDDRKREYAEKLLSNILIRDNIVQDFRFKEEYQVIANLPKNPTLEQLCAGQDSNLRSP